MPALPEETGPLAGIYWPVPRAVSGVDVDQLYNIIQETGILARWESAIRCPCSETRGNKSNRPDCPLCAGDNGWIFVRPQIVHVVMGGFQRERDQFDRLTDLETGRTYITIRSEHAPTFMDRLVLLDARMPFRAKLERTATLADPVERLRWPIVSKSIDLTNGTRLDIGVEYLIPADEDGLPMDPLVEGADFDVVFDADGRGSIDWTKGDALGTAPAPGSMYAIRYQTRPVLRVQTHPHAVRDTRQRLRIPADIPVPLPVQVMTQLEWLVEGGAE